MTLDKEQLDKEQLFIAFKENTDHFPFNLNQDIKVEVWTSANKLQKEKANFPLHQVDEMVKVELKCKHSIENGTVFKIIFVNGIRLLKMYFPLSKLEGMKVDLIPDE